MLTDTPLIAFLATSDPDATLVFYRDTLQLTLIADEPYALVFKAGGTMLRIQKVPQVTAVPYTWLGWQVTDIAAVVERLTAAGVPCEQFPGLPQDERGIMTFAGGARVAWFRDPAGTLLSLTQETS